MVAKKTAAEKTTTSTGAADQDVARQSAHEEAAGHPAAPKKAAPKRAAAKKTPAKKAAPAKAAAKKAAPKKTPAKKAAAGSTTAGKAEAEKTGAKTVVAKKTAAATAQHGTDSAVPSTRAAATPGELAVRPGEDPWTPEEVAEARSDLMAEAGRLRTEIVSAEDAIAGLMRDSGDGAGDDEADTGTKNITREHELALASNAREMLHQTERALGRLDAGTYGLCENCGKPIGKARMQAFPRATLCVECKQKQERR
ncbi:DNA-binding protein [Streptomyces sp. CB02959]|uniref:TraR/DksA family transcriptional regulator n=1 Tax=Streptomyces sp. CB02959 TaxID=2020330 RepID=UPI000C2780DB|nr:TraR/DksA C4-type zinc finger protein [Streptomyces sp. CB02959]PJN41176.1 DNA-binding protein [Streptomyces sp. CB02959]